MASGCKDRENCCFYKCDLHEACLVIAATSILISSIEMATCTVSIVYNHWNLETIVMNMEPNYLLYFTYIYLVIASLNILASGVFFYGILNLKHLCFLPWVLGTVSSMMMNVMFGLFGIAAITNNERPDINYDQPTVIQVMFLYVAGQMLVVVLRINWIGVMAALYVDIKNKLQNDHKEFL